MKHVRRTLFALVCGMAIGAAGVAMLRPPVVASMEGFEPAGISAVEAALETPIAYVNFEKKPLREAVAQLSAMARIPIEVDVEGLQSKQLPVDKPITVQMRGAKLAEVLTRLTQNYNHDIWSRQPRPMLWCALSGRVLLSNAENVNRIQPLVVRSYDVSRIAPQMPRSPSSNLGNFPPSAKDAWIGLINKIHSDDGHTGNPRNTYRGFYVFGDRLVINVPLAAHADIRRMLNELSTPTYVPRKPDAQVISPAGETNSP